MDRRRLLLWAQLLVALTLTVAFGLALAGIVRVDFLLVLAALCNTFRALDEPSRMALVPELVDRARLPNAIALSAIPWQAGRMVWPSVTGVLIAAFGGTLGLALAVAASFVALGLYTRVRVEAHPPKAPREHPLRQFADGIGFVVHDFVFAALIGMALFNAIFGMSYVTLLPIFADDYFKTGSTGFGLLNGAHGAGSVIGTLIVATIAHRITRPGLTLLLVAAAMGLTLVLFSATPGMALAMPVLALVGFSNTFYLTLVTTFIQQRVPDRLRGRVLGIYSLCWNLMPLGGLVAGLLAAAVSARFAVLVGGAMVAANALPLLLSGRLRAIGTARDGRGALDSRPTP